MFSGRCLSAWHRNIFKPGGFAAGGAQFYCYRFLGGFTTFSTYLLDFNHLLSHEKWSEAGIYLVGSIVVGFAFLLAGSRLMKLFL